MSCTNTPMLPQPLAGELLETQTDAARQLRESGEFVSPVLP